MDIHDAGRGRPRTTDWVGITTALAIVCGIAAFIIIGTCAIQGLLTA